MKVAILSESEADETAVRILAQGLLGTEVAIVPLRVRSRGWQAVFVTLPIILKHLHFHTDADGLIVVTDSDHSPMHLESHNQLDGADEDCRLCTLRRIVEHTLKPLAERPCGSPLKTALGLAVPQIEAWYLFGLDPHVGEANWHAAADGLCPFTSNKLKEQAYGNSRPSLELETRRASEHARRIVEQQRLPELRRWFPGGLGALADDLKNW
jgi:hypothetical protein